MYVEISQNFVHRGARLLGVLSESVSTAGIAYKNRMLQEYVDDVESSLKGSVKEVRCCRLNGLGRSLIRNRKKRSSFARLRLIFAVY